MAVTPRALLRGYPWRDTLAHEYVHLVISRLSHNRVPVWLHEGLAEHVQMMQEPFHVSFLLMPGQNVIFPI